MVRVACIALNTAFVTVSLYTQLYTIAKIYAYTHTGIVQRRCLGDDEWEEFFGCFREEAEMLLNQVTLYSSLCVS